MRLFNQVSLTVFSIFVVIQIASLLLSAFSKKFEDRTATITTQSMFLIIISLAIIVITLLSSGGQHQFIVVTVGVMSWCIIVGIIIITGISLVVGKPHEQPQKPMGVDEGKDFIEPVGSHVDEYI